MLNVQPYHIGWYGDDQNKEQYKQKAQKKGRGRR